jgi:hypothetical protein
MSDYLELMDNFGLPRSGVIHVGRNDTSEERFNVAHANVPFAFFEPIPAVYMRATALTAKFPQIRVFHAFCADVDDAPVNITISSNRASPGCTPSQTDIECLEMKTCRLDTALRQYYRPDDFNLAVIDAAGASFMALKGLGDILTYLEAVHISGLDEPLHDSGATLDEVERYMEERGFLREFLSAHRQTAFFKRREPVYLRDAMSAVSHGKPASQSSTQGTWGPEFGNDGDLAMRAKWFHTEKEFQPWWKVDLGRPTDIKKVYLFDRPGHPDRVKSLLVEVSLDDKAFAVVHDRKGLLVKKDQKVVAVSWKGRARFVRLRLADTDYLSMRQVAVIQDEFAAGYTAPQAIPDTPHVAGKKIPSAVRSVEWASTHSAATAEALSTAAILKQKFQQDTSPVFFVRRGDRLIARLKHLLYGWRFAKQAGGRVVMMWPPPGTWSRLDGHNYSPSLIFDTARMAQDRRTQDLEFLETTEKFPRDGRSLEDAEFAPMRNNRFERDFFKQQGLVLFQGNLMHYHFRDENPRRSLLAAELSQLFELLPLHPHVTSLLARIQADLAGTEFVCVHVRAGDCFDKMQAELPRLADNSLSDSDLTRVLGHYVARTAPLELYVPWIEQAVGQGMKIVLSSDSPEQLEWLKRRLGTDQFLDLAGYRAEFPIQKALVDFMVLMRGRRLLGTRSNFSSLACDLGGIEHVIVSAAAKNGMSEHDATQLYFDQAVSKFLADKKLDARAADRLRGEIQRRYKFVNRLGSKEELLLLDPRRPLKSA